MGTLITLPAAKRDNGGFVATPVTVPRGCKGAACPAFAICQGRCRTAKPAQAPASVDRP